ncbi:hypothetical protein [Jeotgalibacillus proteolyticus]|uniref:hypothetical protein n=1 Tax=Jeotgalibacillus proteolyticus TaxID=2082395 RepID=UPI001AD96F31|nr:hypothetical protein [Jeotgalibacillus proteolyticus]
MKFHIENSKINGAINLLSQLSLKGTNSRHRSKMIKALSTHLKEVGDDEKEILKQHCRLDEHGEPKKTADGRAWDVKDLKTFVKDRDELYAEKLILEGGKAWGYLRTVKDILLECEMEWSGADAEIYDYLCDEFERIEEEGLQEETKEESEEKSA